MQQENDIQHPERYTTLQLGWNYRMSDLQAAVCLGQLEDLELHVKQRQDAARNITQLAHMGDRAVSHSMTTSMLVGQKPTDGECAGNMGTVRHTVQ